MACLRSYEWMNEWMKTCKRRLTISTQNNVRSERMALLEILVLTDSEMNAIFVIICLNTNRDLTWHCLRLMPLVMAPAWNQFPRGFDARREWCFKVLRLAVLGWNSGKHSCGHVSLTHRLQGVGEVRSRVGVSGKERQDVLDMQNTWSGKRTWTKSCSCEVGSFTLFSDSLFSLRLPAGNALVNVSVLYAFFPSPFSFFSLSLFFVSV